MLKTGRVTLALKIIEYYKSTRVLVIRLFQKFTGFDQNK